MSWNDVLGQERVKKTLRSIYEAKRIPHAMLFFGPEGIGKEATALEFARVLNCREEQWEACGVCPSCLQFKTLHHPRLKLITALPGGDSSDSGLGNMKEEDMDELNAQIEEKARNPYSHISLPNAKVITIGTIREIKRQSSFRSSGSGRTVYVICEADRMQDPAANALLKTLEEPSGDILLILTTSRRNALLPTILSRCQLLRFDLLSEDDIREGLLRAPGLDQSRIADAAFFACGNYCAAMELASDGAGDFLKPMELVIFLRIIVKNDPVELYDKVQQYAKKEAQRNLQTFLIALSAWFRNVMAIKEGVPVAMSNKDVEASLWKFSEHYPDVRCTEAVGEIEKAIELLRKNVHLVNVLLVMAHRLRQCILSI
jgi:DNA polymerase III subunit delta'